MQKSTPVLDGTRAPRWLSVRLVPVVVAVALALPGCRSKKQQECREFVHSVNARLADIDRIVAQQSDVTPEDMAKLAQSYEQLAERTKAISIGTADLDQLRVEYGATVLDAAKLAKEIASALEAKNVEAAMKSHEQFSNVVSREDELVKKINAFCQAAH